MLLYIYDVDQKSPTYTNARRVAFFKRIFGYKYQWRGKYGNKIRIKKGLIHLSENIERVGDSAIIIPEQYADKFNEVFREFQDMVKLRIFKILSEIR